MPKLRISRKAHADLREIARYTVERWGAEQAEVYIAALKMSFQIVVQAPRMGRLCDAVSSGLRRHEQGKHVVFYRTVPGGIHVVRVLHQQIMPTQAHFEP